MNIYYAAGFFDGEGCVYIARTLRAIISGTFRPGLLEQFSSEWGGSVAPYRRPKAHWKPGVRWEVTGPKAGRFLSDVLPYLYEKKLDAEIGLEYHDLKQSYAVRGGKGYAPEQASALKSIQDRLKARRKAENHYSWMDQ